MSSLFALEEKFRADRFKASLPVRRADIVLARYGEALALTMVYLILAYCASVAFHFSGFSDASYPITLKYGAGILNLVTISTGLIFTLYFWLGLTRGTAAAMVLGAAVVVLFLVTWAILRTHEAAWHTAQNLAALAFSRSPNQMAAALVLLGFAVLWWAIAIPLSVRLYKKRVL